MITAVLVLLLIVSIARVEHIIASDVWILARGHKFRSKLEAAMRSPEGNKKMSDQSRRWDLYRDLDGGKLPWLFFGIQSTRLLAMSERATGRLRRSLFRPLRGLWRFYTFAPATTVVVVLSVWMSDSRLNAWLALAVMATMMLGCIGIAAGGVLAAQRMGAFARYHHLRWPPAEERDLAHHELSLVVGSALIALVCVTGFVLTVGVDFDGFGYFSEEDSLWTQTWKSLFLGLTGLFGQSAKPANGFGAFGVAVVTLTQASYVIILLAATNKAWSGGHASS